MNAVRELRPAIKKKGLCGDGLLSLFFLHLEILYTFILMSLFQIDFKLIYTVGFSDTKKGDPRICSSVTR